MGRAASAPPSTASELLRPALPDRIREVAVERKDRVAHHRIDGKVQALDGLATGCDLGERLVELSQITGLDHRMEVAQLARPEAELAPGEAPTNDHPLLFQVSQVGAQPVAEFSVRSPGLEVEPNVVDVHRRPLSILTAQSITRQRRPSVVTRLVYDQRR